MPITRFPMSLIKNEESMEDADSSLSPHQAAKVHKQSIKGHNLNVHSLSGDFHQKPQGTPPRAATEKAFHHPFHLYSPPNTTTARISSALSPHLYQSSSSFSMANRGSQLPQYPSVESQMYKTESQDEGTPVARGLNSFVNMYAPPHDSIEQRQGQRQQHNTGYPVGSISTPLSPWEESVATWGPQSNPARIFMNSTPLPTEPSEGNTRDSVEHLEDPQFYREGPFAPSQESYSFTWDMKEDRTVVESNKPKRRKLTASERARTKALKLAGGACDNCRRKKKKCTHKDLTDIKSLEEGQLADEKVAGLQNKPPSVIDRDIQSRLYTYSGTNNSVLAYMGPEDDPGMHTPSDTPSFAGGGFNVPEFPLDTAEIGQQFE
ncbi:hypothetical protein PISL3812_05250 [Talaromyces islandicus]|uniref:Zn(2)-C6 fungal-type domain-containing protein n=1 Tax=Talaromyces islandicus TaxID=28573 RepID=A0A0U1LXY7_TALIS|nr:hypothetical protein PISL3812_05250 [Talaromyces islandicus]